MSFHGSLPIFESSLFHMRTSLTIRRAGAERIDELEHVWAALHEHHVSVTPHFAPPRTIPESWAIRKENYATWLQASEAYLLIAEVEQQIVGYAMVRPTTGSTTWRVDKIMEIETLAVLPESRGQEVGRQLVDQVMADAAEQGIDEVVLLVVSTNEEAIGFYERQGFEPQYLHMHRKLKAKG